jgi:hypothetical protein
LACLFFCLFRRGVCYNFRRSSFLDADYADDAVFNNCSDADFADDAVFNNCLDADYADFAEKKKSLNICVNQRNQRQEISASIKESCV